MKTWKIILSTLVIFVAGIATGVLLVWRLAPHERPRLARPPQPFNRPWEIQRPEFFQRLRTELKLSPGQAQKVENILRQSHQRTEPLWELIGPLLQEEMGKVRAEIKEELTPEQQRRFEESLKVKQPKRPDVEGNTNRTSRGRSMAHPEGRKDGAR